MKKSIVKGMSLTLCAVLARHRYGQLLVNLALIIDIISSGVPHAGIPFAMLTGVLLDNEVFSNVSVSNGKIVNDGDRTAMSLNRPLDARVTVVSRAKPSTSAVISTCPGRSRVSRSSPRLSWRPGKASPGSWYPASTGWQLGPPS